MKEPIKDYKPAEKLELPKIKKDFPKVFKKVSCPSCSEAVTAENLNLQNSVAKCGSCHAIFSIEEEMDAIKVKEEMKQEVFRPEGIDLFYYKDDLEISMETPVNQWDIAGLMLFISSAGFGIPLYLYKGMPILFLMIAILGTLYFTFRLMIYKNNRTIIDINDHSLTVKHRPNNIKKDKTFLAEDIDQVYLKYSTTQGTMQGTYYLDIYVIVNGSNGQKHQKLLSVNTLTKAKYLEQEIENYLGIKDRKVLESNA
jgi:hypothetical protein